jgi:hypothetical protein
MNKIQRRIVCNILGVPEVGSISFHRNIAIHQITRYHNRKEYKLNPYCRENLKSHKECCLEAVVIVNTFGTIYI